MWSKKYSKCEDCGTTERRHKGRGRCNSCYLKLPDRRFIQNQYGSIYRTKPKYILKKKLGAQKRYKLQFTSKSQEEKSKTYKIRYDKYKIRSLDSSEKHLKEDTFKLRNKIINVKQNIVNINKRRYIIYNLMWGNKNGFLGMGSKTGNRNN